MTGRLYKFRLWCVEEEAFLEHWAAAEPDACPHNGAHALDHAQTTVLDSMVSGSTEVTVKEEQPESQTGGNFRRLTKKLVLPILENTAILDLSWPYPVSLLAGQYFPHADSVGDEVDVMGAPGTLVGVLTAPAAEGATVLNVSPTVIANVKAGFELTVGAQDCGEVIAVNAADGTVTVETPLATPEDAGAYVTMTAFFAKGLRLNSTARVAMGESKTGSSYLPAGRVIRLVYHRLNGVVGERTFPFDMELLY